MSVMDDSNELSEEELENLLTELPAIIHELELDALQEERWIHYMNSEAYSPSHNDWEMVFFL